MGGAVAAVDYMKRRLVESNAQRLVDIENGDQSVVGVNMFTEAEAHAAVGMTEIADGSQDPRRRDFYLWCRQNGLGPEKVGDHDPIEESDHFTPYSPEENVDSSYPPTLLLHGNNDTDVPYEQSVLMASKLKSAGIEHELITIENGPHGFDHNPESADTPEVQAAFERVIEFLKSHT